MDLGSSASCACTILHLRCAHVAIVMKLYTKAASLLLVMAVTTLDIANGM